MEMRLASLRFVIEGHLHMYILPGAGSRCHSFFLYRASNDAPHYLKRNKNPVLCLRLGHGVKFLYSFWKAR
jgi:hypothetical protein